MWDNIANDFPVNWKSRRKPLDAIAVAGRGVTKLIIMERLRRRAPSDLIGLHLITFNDYFVILGDPCNLPWATGAIYMGRDPKAPNLLLPTMLEPTLSTNVLERVLSNYSGYTATAIAVFARPLYIMPIVDARPLTEEPSIKWIYSKSITEAHTQTALA